MLVAACSANEVVLALTLVAMAKLVSMDVFQLVTPVSVETFVRGGLYLILLSSRQIVGCYEPILRGQ